MKPAPKLMSKKKSRSSLSASPLNQTQGLGQLSHLSFPSTVTRNYGINENSRYNITEQLGIEYSFFAIGTEKKLI